MNSSPPRPWAVPQRVVVTGMGALSSLGCDLDTISESLRESRSGIVARPGWAALGLRSQIAGDVTSRDDYLRRLQRSRFKSRQLEVAGPVAAHCLLATEDALEGAGLLDEPNRALLSDRRFGCIVGSGVSGLQTIYEGAVNIYAGNARRVRPYAILQGMSSTVSAHLVQHFGFGGRSYSLSSACSTATHSIAHASELIRAGLLRAAVAGGGDEVGPLTAAAFNAMRSALSTRFNDQPDRASRPFDAQRDGFVLSGGAGVLVLESLDSAQERGAEIKGEILGSGANSDAHDIVQPEPEGRSAGDCMNAALEDAGLDPADIDYVNAHGTGTLAGDVAEATALRRVFSACGVPPFSSTKSLGGHALGAAGALEAIHCLLMMRDGFLAATANLEEPDPAILGLDAIARVRQQVTQRHLSNSFGFGGTNASLVLGAASLV